MINVGSESDHKEKKMNGMTKKQIKAGLKNNGVKGFSRAIIVLETRWVMVGCYCGKLDDNNMLYLKPINLNDKTSRHYVIQF